MSFKLSTQATQFVDTLTRNLRLPNRSGVLKMTFAKGLRECPSDLPLPGDSKGAEIPLNVVESPLFNALLRQKFNIKNLDDKDKRRYYKGMVEYGARVLHQEFDYDAVRILINLAKQSDLINKGSSEQVVDLFSNSKKGSSGQIMLDLGTDDDSASVRIIWNDKDQTGQHLGITGKTGAGKTQFVLELLSQMHEQSQGKVNIIFFDYAKGDVASNQKFVNLTQAQVVDVAMEGVPYNPFYLEEVTDQKIDELKDIITSVQKSIGPKQSLTLYDILRECYDQKSEPDLSFVYETMLEHYEETNKAKDVLVELFHKLEVPKIFPEAEQEGLLRNLSDKNLIFDLSKLDSHMKVKELVSFLLLNKIYTESIRMPDSEVNPGDNTREMRTIVVIDEAHNYLNCKNKVLEKMLRELRSKGVAVMLLTQGFSDFDQKEFDYSSMLNWIFLMKSDNSKQDVEKALAISRDKANSLFSRISIAESGEVFTRCLNEAHKDFSHFNAKMFWAR